MADEKPAGQAPAEGGEGAAPQPSAPADGGSGEQKPSGEGQGDQKLKADDKAPEKPQDDDAEPPVRKTKLDYILERKQRKLEKAKSQEIQKVDDQLKKPADDGSGEGDGEDDEISPEEEKAIEKVVTKKFGHHFEQLNEEREEAELQGFINQNPKFKPYEAKIRKFANHPSRQHLPLQSIAYEVAGPDLMRIGAEEARKADAEAAKSTTGGGSARNDSAHKPVSEMSSAEFREYSDKVRRGIIVLK